VRCLGRAALIDCSRSPTRGLPRRPAGKKKTSARPGRGCLLLHAKKGLSGCDWIERTYLGLRTTECCGEFLRRNSPPAEGGLNVTATAAPSPWLGPGADCAGGLPVQASSKRTPPALLMPGVHYAPIFLTSSPPRMAICFGAASSFLGSVIFSTPFRNTASILPASTVSGSRIARLNSP